MKSSPIFTTGFVLLIILGFGILIFASFGFSNDQIEKPILKDTSTNNIENIKQEKMKVEIWSDIMCPFCYIGKRKFDNALAQFPQRDKVEVVWHSFQLNPNIKPQAGKDLYTYVAELKGQTREWSVKVHEGLIQQAKELGLDYRFDKAQITNSFDAHRVIQLAKTHNFGTQIEERFFKAYFTEGALMSDHPTLIKLAVEVGLDKNEVEQVLKSNKFAVEVDNDGARAQQLGATGVPFFVINGKRAVAGAQDTKVFLQLLEDSYKEWQKDNSEPKLEIIQGKVCKPDGECD